MESRSVLVTLGMRRAKFAVSVFIVYMVVLSCQCCHMLTGKAHKEKGPRECCLMLR